MQKLAEVLRIGGISEREYAFFLEAGTEGAIAGDLVPCVVDWMIVGILCPAPALLLNDPRVECALIDVNDRLVCSDNTTQNERKLLSLFHVLA